MKLRIGCVIVGFLSLVLSLVQLTFAQTPTQTASALPRLVRFGGTVKDLNGNPLTGVVGVTFALYSEQTGGASLWLETQNVTADSNGHYTVLLGSTKPDGLPADLFTSEQAHWVGVQVSGQAEQPRVLLVSAPYALKAGDAETIGGLPPSAFMLAAPPTGGSARASAAAVSKAGSVSPATATDVTTTGGTADYLPVFNGASTIIDSVVYQSGAGSTAKVGINTSTPAATLDVNGTVNAATSFNLGRQSFAFGSFSNENDFLGFSGNSTMTGTHNVANGYQALFSNTTGSFNTASGVNALHSNTTGNENTACGVQALYSNSAGPYNTASGFQALFSNTSGSFNTANGLGALFGNTTASYNTASGYEALFSNTTGSSNTASGYEALYSNTTGPYNSGSGFQALFSNTTGLDNTASGYKALYSNTTGNENTASGVGALFSNTTGLDNTASGNLALYSNTTGNYNAASGGGALYSNTSGSYNTASGSLALNDNTTGLDNTASGYQALNNNTIGIDNTASGFAVLYSNTNGSRNTASGFQALFSNTTGVFNTALGVGAGSSSETGSYNTFLGANTQPVGSNLSNATAIGANAWVGESNAMVLGSINKLNGATASTDVGIGTTVPLASLDVAGNKLETLIGDPGCGTGYAGIAFGTVAFNTCTNYSLVGDGSHTYINAPAAGNIHLRINNADAMFIASTGQVAIGTSTPAGVALLTVNGGAAKLGGGSWSAISDRRLKTLQGDYKSGLDQIVKLNPVRYRYKDHNAMDIHDAAEHVGLVAQEVQRVIPEAVTENSKGYLLVNNDPIIWAMLNAIKEQQGEFRQERAELAKALRQIKQQQSLLRAQSAAMQSLKTEVRETRETLRKVKAQVDASQLTVVAAK